MKKLVLVILLIVVLGSSDDFSGRQKLVTPALARTTRAEAGQALKCIAFSPYIKGYNPKTGPHPTEAVIRQLLVELKRQTSFRCIMTYGVLNGLSKTFKVAKAEGFKVIAVIWLDENQTTNDRSITQGINIAKAYPATVIRLSCGSEIRTRANGKSMDSVIIGCINRLRQAGVSQPITSIDTWWEWCNRPGVPGTCQKSSLSAYVDWIGINVYPWWENKYSGMYPCTSADQAADFHIARMLEVKNRYPNKEVILTEFGWPAGPSGYRETNLYTGQECGVANNTNQNIVMNNTLAKLREKGWSGVAFEAFREPWKKTDEGSAGPFWGICRPISSAPYWICKKY
jgi:exo-beta-1,3-glucanase (GH17 family)